MTVIELPALRSDDPVGFLAALGVVELCTSALAMSPRLSWAGLGGHAVLDCGVSHAGELADRLAGVALRWRESGCLVPPEDPEFISPPLSTAQRRERRVTLVGLGAEPLDPMRMSPEQAGVRFVAERARELVGFADGARWLAGLMNQLAAEPNGDRCELTPLYARTGQQNLYQLYRDYRDKVAKRPLLVRAALSNWERVSGDSGANLDGRALRDGAAMGDGKPDNAAVPGAIWLALQSVPYFPLVGDGTQAGAVGWRTMRRGGRPRRLVWPVWREPLDRAAIEVLLAHPALDTPGASPAAGALGALGVVAVCTATRSALGNSDGPLQGVRVVWSA